MFYLPPIFLFARVISILKNVMYIKSESSLSQHCPTVTQVDLSKRVSTGRQWYRILINIELIINCQIKWYVSYGELKLSNIEYQVSMDIKWPLIANWSLLDNTNMLLLVKGKLLYEPSWSRLLQGWIFVLKLFYNLFFLLFIYWHFNIT